MGILFIKPFPSKLSSKCNNFKRDLGIAKSEEPTDHKNNCATLLQVMPDRFIFATLLYIV